ncbi:MAG: B12-binding domain-containing radical SAM protein [Candidatus Omnitrophica bacterium]|nr:B12-binding domain-containing radical SAM protein [Candidatus Omnitrophota bacterium]
MTAKRILLLRITPSILRTVNHPVHHYPPLTLKYIQSILSQKNFINLKLIDDEVDHLKSAELIKQISYDQPDILVLFANFISPDFIRAFSQRLKQVTTDLFIIAIGPVATWNRESLLCNSSPIDVVISGEAEQAVAELIEQLSSGDNSTQDYYRQKFMHTNAAITVEDLNSLPYLEFSKQELKKYSFIYPVRLNKKVYCGYMETSRGCVCKCIFCSQYIRKSYSDRLRFKDAKRVVDEVENLVSKGANFISFEDDNFASASEHVFSICKEIKRRKLKIKWAAEVTIDEVNEELLKEMRSAGCEFLQLGVESGSGRIIGLLNKTNQPETWGLRCKKIFNMARQIGIATCALLMIGSPTETEEDIRKSINLAICLRPDLIKLHFFCFYPGSKARETFSEQLIDAKRIQYMYHHDYPYINLSKIHSGRLIELRREFYKRVLLSPRFIMNHLCKYFLYYLCNLGNFKFLISKTLSLLRNKKNLPKRFDLGLLDKR